MRSLRARLIGLFVLMSLVVAAVIIVAVDQFSAERVMRLIMEGVDSPEEAQLMFDEYVGRVLLIASVVAVVLGSIASWWVLRRILRPLERLTDATRSIAAGNLSTRVPQPEDAELHALAASFNQMASSLERVEELRRSLVEDVAHELRTPLTTLRGYTEALADGVAEPTPETLRTIHEEIERLTRLVEALDELARGERRAVAAPQEVDLLATVERALDLASPDLTRRSIQVDVRRDGAPRMVRGDFDGIRQVVSNVVQNAVRYSDDGGTIEVRLTDEDGWVRCAVANSGDGVPENELPLIWERLHRVDSSRSRESGGAGIGLAIVREIVEAHGGDVGASSRDRRTEIWFTLPREAFGAATQGSPDRSTGMANA